jgi:Ca2+-binding RTX toxin-like protein
MSRLIAFALVALACLAAAVPASARRGDLLVAEYDSSEVLRITPSGAQSVISAAAALQSPSDLALMTNGDLVVTDEVAPAVFRVRPNGTTTSLAAEADGLDGPYGTGPFGKRATFLDYNAPMAVFDLNPLTGSLSPIFSGTQALNSVGLETNGGVAYLAGYNATPPAIYRVNLTTGAVSTVASGPPLELPYDVSTAPNGQLLALNRASPSNTLVSVNPKTGSMQTVTTLPQQVDGDGLDVAPNGDVYLSDYHNPGAIQRVDSRTDTATEVASGGSITGPGAVVVEPPRCGGLFPSVIGFKGKDVLRGSPRADVIAGLGGKDTIKGLGGKDIICGGGGRDKLLGGKGKDRLLGGKGRDSCIGGPGRDRQLSC